MATETDKVLATRIEAIDEKLDRVLYAVEGNGSPGLKTRVALLEEKQGRISKVMWIAVTGIVGAIIGIFKVK